MAETNKHITQTNKLIVRNYTISGILLGLMFTAFAWFAGFLSEEYILGISGFRKMHADNGLYYIMDVMPVVLGLVAYILGVNAFEKQRKLQESIDQKDRLIRKNAEFAQQIGEGNFSVEDYEITQDDTLGHSLVLMRNNLVST